MKHFVWLATLSLLILGIYSGTMIQGNQPLQSAMFSEGSIPNPEMHQGSPALAAERGEGSYPTPGCSPSNPNCQPFVVEPKLQAGEGSYPTPGCSPSNPNCQPFAAPARKIAMLGEGSAPAPFDMPGGMN